MTNEQKYLIYLDYLGVKEKYFENRKKLPLYTNIMYGDDFLSFINNCFDWGNTKEGFDFWADIAQNGESHNDEAIDKIIHKELRNLKLNRVL